MILVLPSGLWCHGGCGLSNSSVSFAIEVGVVGGETAGVGSVRRAGRSHDFTYHMLALAVGQTKVMGHATWVTFDSMHVSARGYFGTLGQKKI